MAAVEIIWLVTLVLIVLITPLVVYMCWRLVRAARNVERHFAVTLQAAAGIARSTAAVPALEDTIATAGGILTTAGSVDKTSGAIEELLVGRLQRGTG
jgi:hypothetical protein